MLQQWARQFGPEHEAQDLQDSPIAGHQAPVCLELKANMRLRLRSLRKMRMRPAGRIEMTREETAGGKILTTMAVCLFIQAHLTSAFLFSQSDATTNSSQQQQRLMQPMQPMQQVYGANMSAMMTMMNQPSGPAQMTNASLLAQMASTSGPSNSNRTQASNSPAKASTKAGQVQPQASAMAAGANPRQPKQPVSLMAAEDSQDSQSFVTINSGSTSVSDAAPKPPKQPAAAATAAAAAPSNLSKTSRTSSSSSPKMQQQQQKVLQQQPPVAARPKFVAQLSQAQQQDLSMQALMMQQQQQQQQQRYQQQVEQVEQLEQPPAPQLQLERPSPPGYAYEPSSSAGYTHTSPLQPARQEVLVAEQVAQKQQRFRLPTGTELAASRAAHSVHFPGPSAAVEAARSVATASSSQQQQHIEQVNIGPPAKGGAARPPHQANQFPAPMLAQPHLSITGTATNPCKPPQPFGSSHQHHQQQPQELFQQQQALNHQDVASAAPNFSQWPTTNSYERAGHGTRLRSQYIFKVIRADSLTDCELACSRASSLASNNPQEACRSFNYRPYFAAENCELSRHDVRSLELKDKAQFEQDTQFDFYALQPQPQQQQAAQLTAAGSSNSLVYSPFPEPECLDVSQSCSQDGMEFTLRTTEPFNGRIYTYGFYDSCFFDGEGALTSVLRISRSNGFPRCGTQLIGDLMTNIVVVQFNDYVQTTRDKKYNLTCFFSGPGEAVVTSNYLDTKIDERSHPMQIEHLPPQNVITSNVQLRVLYRNQPTNTIALGDMLTFRLETKSLLHGSPSAAQHRAATGGAGGGDHGGHEIFATNVIAKDPYSGRQVQLIDARGCPIDPVHVFPELQRTPDGALEAEFYAFKIPDSNFLIFQATVRTCKAPCEPVICQTTQSLSNSNQLAQYTQVPLQANGIKGGSSLPAYLLQAGQHHQQQQHSSVPSWGKRRRRRRRRRDLSASLVSTTINNNNEDEDEDEDEIVGASQLESVEHVIPIRSQSDSPSGSAGAPAVRTWRQPELSEPEEEVKEMFRVYMSRAEINRQQRERASLMRSPIHSPEALPAASSSSNQLIVDPNNDPSNHQQQQQQHQELKEQICMTLFGYHVMLFTVIALSLLMLSVLLVSLYIAKRAKFRVSDSLADSIF